MSNSSAQSVDGGAGGAEASAGGAGEVVNFHSYSGGGGGDSRGGRGVDSETQRYVDLKTEATRAQNDARFAEVRSDLAAIGAKLDSAPSRWTVVGAAVSLFLGLLAVLAFAGDRFDGGMSAADLVVQQRENSSRLDGVDHKLGVILEILGKGPQ